MPNWVSNSVTIVGDEDVLRQLSMKIAGPDTVFDMSKIIPIPKNIKEDQINDWCNSHWGTKWNTENADVGKEFIGNKSSLLYSFLTAWSSPLPIFLELSRQFPTIELLLTIDDEEVSYIESRTIRKGLIVNSQEELRDEYDDDDCCRDDEELNMLPER